MTLGIIIETKKSGKKFDVATQVKASMKEI